MGISSFVLVSFFLPRIWVHSLAQGFVFVDDISTRIGFRDSVTYTYLTALLNRLSLNPCASYG